MKKPHVKSRRGLSLIEVIISLLIISMASVVILSTVSSSLNFTRRSSNYLTLRSYNTNLYEQINRDLQNGEYINDIDYNDYGNTSNIIATVNITDLGTVLGKNTYLIEIRTRVVGTTDITVSRAVLREGST